ncbi:hypothetical protein SM8_026175, partial [Streptomyces sp. SM8]
MTRRVEARKAGAEPSPRRNPARPAHEATSEGGANPAPRETGPARAEPNPKPHPGGDKAAGTFRSEPPIAAPPPLPFGISGFHPEDCPCDVPYPARLQAQNRPPTTPRRRPGRGRRTPGPQARPPSA